MPPVKDPDSDKLNRARNPGDEHYKRAIRRYNPAGRRAQSGAIKEAGEPTQEPDNYGGDSDEDRFDGYRKQEENPEAPGTGNDEDLATRESRGASPRPDVYHKSNVQPSAEGGRSRFQGLRKKRNAIMVTFTMFAGTVGLIAFITAPAFFLVHVKEVYLKKFGDRMQSLQQVRVNRIVTKQLTSDPLTAGCGVVKVKCRYKGITQRQINKFERRNPGVEIRTDGRTALGKHKVTSITYIDENGRNRTIEAKDFRRAAKNSIAFQKLIINYNKSKVAMWRDKTAGKVFTKLKISLAKVRAPRGPPQTENEIRQQREERQQQRDARRLAVAQKYRGTIRKADIISTVCAIKGLITLAKVAVKVGLAADEAKFAMDQIGRPGDTIKAGLATGDSQTTNGVSNAAYTLTQEDGNGKTMSDSFGYQYASAGVLIKDRGNQPDYQLGVGPEKGLLGKVTDATQGVPGLEEVSAAVTEVLNPTVCTAAGVISVGFCAVTLGYGCAANLAASAALVNIAMPVILKNIVKTPDVETAVGGDAGDAATGGFGHLAKTNNQYRGAYPLTKNQAVRYDTFSDNAQGEGNWDNVAFDFHNPGSFAGKLAAVFLPPMARMSTSSSSIPTTLASLPGLSLLRASTAVQAKSVITGEYEQCDDADYKALDIATDPFCVPQYGFNPSLMLGDTSYNKPTAALEKNKQPKETSSLLAWLFETPTASAADDGDDTRGFMPDDRYDADLVISFMHDGVRPWIDDDGAAIAYDDSDDDYVDYTEQCLETTDPLESGSPDMCKPKKCTDASTSSNEFRYCMYSVYTGDTSIDDQLEDRYAEVSGGGSATGTDDNEASQTAGAEIDTANLTKESKSVDCAEGTKDLGVHDGYTAGKKIEIRVCSIPGFPSTGEESNGGYGVSGAGGNTVVNSRVSGAVKAMVAAAKADGVNLTAISSFRTMSHQQALCPCDGVRVARPGTSNHQLGVAIDFGGGLPSSAGPIPGNAFWKWLSENASKYGYKNYPAEAWHWSPFGS